MRMLDQLTANKSVNKNSKNINDKPSTMNKTGYQFRAFIEMQDQLHSKKDNGTASAAYLFESDEQSVRLAGTQEQMGKQEKNNFAQGGDSTKQKDTQIDSTKQINTRIDSIKQIDIRTNSDFSLQKDTQINSTIQKAPVSEQPAHIPQGQQPIDRPLIKMLINEQMQLQIQSNKNVAQVLGPYCRGTPSKNERTKKRQNSTVVPIGYEPVKKQNSTVVPIGYELVKKQNHTVPIGYEPVKKQNPTVPFVYELVKNVWTVNLHFHNQAVNFLKKYFRFENIPRDTIRILIRNMKEKEVISDVFEQMDGSNTKSKMADGEDHNRNSNEPMDQNNQPLEKNKNVKPKKIPDSHPHSENTISNNQFIKKECVAVADPHLMNISKYLLPHQKQAVNTAIHKSGRVILADEMGLGKTVTALAIAAYYKHAWPLLIICPGGLMENWRNEIDKFLNHKHAPLDVAIIRSIRDLTNQDILIVSYDFLWRNIEYFKGYVQENKKTVQNKDMPKRHKQGGVKKNIQERENIDLFESGSSEGVDETKKRDVNGISSFLAELNKTEQGDSNNKNKIKQSDLNNKNKIKQINLNQISSTTGKSKSHFSYQTDQINLNQISSTTAKSKSYFSYQKRINMVICDEAHYLKTRDSKRSRSIIPFIKGMTRILLVTGTPALSRPLELYNLVNILHDFNQRDFLNRYCLSLNTNSKYKKDFNRYKGCQNEQELRQLLSTMMIRRTKELLMRELPTKIREHFILECETIEYNKLGGEAPVERQDNAHDGKILNKNNFLSTFFKGPLERNSIEKEKKLIADEISLSDDEGISIKPFSEHARSSDHKQGHKEIFSLKQAHMPDLTRSGSIMADFQLAAYQKVAAVQKYVHKWLEHNKEEKLVLFAHHKVMMDGIETMLKQMVMEKKFNKPEDKNNSGHKNMDTSKNSKDVGKHMSDESKRMKDVGKHPKDESKHTKDVGKNSKDVGKQMKDESKHLKDVGKHVKDESKHVKNESKHVKGVGKNSKDVGKRMNDESKHSNHGNACEIAEQPQNTSDTNDNPVGFDYIRIDGGTPQQNRARLVHSFQTDRNVRVALLSITSASTGITLHSSNTVIFTELWWNPGNILQAEDRVHRLGQKSSVSIIFLLGRDTVDEIVWPKLIEKLKVLEKMDVGENVFGKVSTREGERLNFFKRSKRSQ